MRLFPQVNETIPSRRSKADAKDALLRARINLPGYSYVVELVGPDALSFRPIHDGTLWTNAFVPLLCAQLRAKETCCAVAVTGELRKSVKLMTVILFCVLAAFAVLAVVLSIQNRESLLLLLPMALFGVILWAVPQIGLRLTFARVLSQLRAFLAP